MKKIHGFLAVLAIVLVLSASIGAASAYFSTYADAKGGYMLHLGHETEIHEEVDGTVKSVRIQNIADAAEDIGQYPVFARVKVYHGSDCTVTVTGADGNWEEKEAGVYYYRLPLFANDPASPASGFDWETSVLTADVQPADPDLKAGDVIDVVISYDTVPALYTTGGAPDLELSWQGAGALHVING